jgi:hypothetical protein
MLDTWLSGEDALMEEAAFAEKGLREVVTELL